MNRRHFVKTSILVLLLLSVLALLVTACGGTTAQQSGGTPIKGGTVTFAENQASGPIDYIFPLYGLAYDTPSNIQFMLLQWRPLYWFGMGSQAVLNEQLSVAQLPQYSDNNSKVTITLKPWLWSDGKSVTTRDVDFWINLVKANRTDWTNYTPGHFPDNIKKVTIDSPTQMTLTLNASYSPDWFTSTQLAQITPLPQHVWDKTSTSSPVGNYDQSSKGAQAVYKYLDQQAKKLTAYTTNPLWSVVDGPWKLQSFRTDGYAAVIPNSSYSGTPKPQIAKFVMEPFASDSAEANVLRSGGVTYGYVPFEDLPAAKTFENAGYSLSPWASFSIGYIVINFNNPTMGPVFHQLYVRQAMQSLIDQPGYIKAFLGISGIPTYGPVPPPPLDPYVTAAELQNPYPFNPQKAISMLSSHGWKVQPNGVTTAVRVGTGPNECGKGIAAGTKLEFTIRYLSGVTYLTQEMESLKSAFSAAGIVVNLTQGTEGQVVSTAVAATAGPAAKWQSVQWGTPSWIWPSGSPTGEVIFGTGGGVNPGSYSDATNDANIAAIQTSTNAQAAWSTYVSYLAAQLPVLWFPNTVNQVSAISTRLHGATPQSALTYLTPESWYLTN